MTRRIAFLKYGTFHMKKIKKIRTLKILWQVVQICQFAKSHGKPNKNFIFQSPNIYFISVLFLILRHCRHTRVPQKQLFIIQADFFDWSYDNFYNLELVTPWKCLSPSPFIKADTLNFFSSCLVRWCLRGKSTCATSPCQAISKNVLPVSEKLVKNSHFYNINLAQNRKTVVTF